MQRKASKLQRKDVFRLSVSGQVLAITPIAGGKLVKIKLALENQGHRNYRGDTNFDKASSLEFLDGGHVLEFICRASRVFHLLEWYEDDDGDDGDEIVTPPLVLSDA